MNMAWFKSNLWMAMMLMGLGLLSPHAHAQNAPAAAARGDYIVAVVNERPITNQEVRLHKRLRAFLGQDTSASDMDVVNRLIDSQLVVMEAERLGIKVTELQIERELSDLAKANQLSVEQLRSRFEGVGIPWSFIEQFISEQLLFQRVRVDRVIRPIKLSPAEVQQVMDKALASMRTRQVSLSQILVPVPEGASTETEQSLKLKAEQLRQAVIKGKPFADAANEVATSKESANGGDLGQREIERWPDLFVQAIKGLKEGELSSVIRSGAGWHVLRLNADKINSALPTYPQTLARHILHRASTPQDYAAGRDKLMQLRERIVRGEIDFAEAAKRYSEDASSFSGGTLGWAAPGNFVPEFEAAMNELQPGQVSPPVATEFGVHLIEVLQRRMVEMTRDQIKQQVENQLREQKAGKATEDWLLNLRGRAFIEMREPPQ